MPNWKSFSKQNKFKSQKRKSLLKLTWQKPFPLYKLLRRMSPTSVKQIWTLSRLLPNPTLTSFWPWNQSITCVQRVSRDKLNGRISRPLWWKTLSNRCKILMPTIFPAVSREQSLINIFTPQNGKSLTSQTPPKPLVLLPHGLKVNFLMLISWPKLTQWKSKSKNFKNKGNVYKNKPANWPKQLTIFKSAQSNWNNNTRT